MGNRIEVSGRDANAVHVDRANEFSALTEKTSTTSNDLLVLEDSAASYVKKKLKISNLPGGAGGLAYLGVWNASTNTPTLSDGSGLASQYYVVSVAGTTTIDGISEWAVGDMIISNDTAWDKVDQSEVMVDDGTDVGTAVAGRNITLGTGGMKDNDVTVAVALGDGSNTSAATTNKSILGAINEVNTASGLNTTHRTTPGDDDHTQYTLLAGRSGGQTIAGSTLTTENMTLRANAADLTTGQINVTSNKEASDTTTGAVAIAGGLAVAKRVYALDMTVTNAITGSVTGNAGTVSTITGLAPDTATTQASQPNITSVGTLTGLSVDGALTVNESGADVDFRVESDTIENALFLDGATGNVGIGAVPTANMAGLSVEAGVITLKETTTPTADTNYAKIYSKTDNLLYYQDGAGSEHSLSAGGDVSKVGTPVDNQIGVWTGDGTIEGTPGLVYTSGTSLVLSGSIGVTGTRVSKLWATDVEVTNAIVGKTTIIGAATMTLGSDADGDIYYRSSNTLTRLAKGTANQQLTMNAGATAPEWDSGNYYDTLWVAASAMVPLTTNGAEFGSAEYATNDIMMDYLAFDGATEEFVAFSINMPDGWDLSTIKAKFYWAPGSSACTAGDTCEWELAARAISNDDAIDAALGTAQVISDTVTDGKDADLHITSATPALTVGGTPALADMTHFKLSRNVSGTDDMTEDAWLFGVAIQFQRTNIGVAAW